MKYDNMLRSDRLALADAVTDTLRAAGFTQASADRLPPRTREMVFEREVTNSGKSSIVIQVWTSIENGYMRTAGKDAIRVATVFIRDDGNQRGVAKERRVHRTGEIDAIAQRMLGRMRDAWKGVASLPRCSQCNSPKFTSKIRKDRWTGRKIGGGGNEVCAAFCWK